MWYKTEKIPAGDINFFLDMIPYISRHIEEIRRGEDGVEILYSEDHQEEVLASLTRLENMIGEGKFAKKDVKPTILEDFTDVPMQNTENIFEELLARGIIRKITEGVYAYSDIFLKVFRYFDRKIEENGFKQFPGIREYEFPVLYPLESYQTGGYFESFPHHIMFQSLMKNDIEVIDRFAQKGVEKETLGNDMQTPVNVLRHAACVPVYEFLKNQIISPDTPEIYLVSGKCFRNEAGNVKELARLNEFFMKEYVFVGTAEQCEESVKKAKRLWLEWIRVFGLNCRISTATDSFFASNYKKLKLFQILGNSKQEFQVCLPGSDMFSSCGSVNFHRTHFTKPYNIRSSEDSYCYSACCAFGIDRLSYALLSQKGLDPDRWDQETYDEIFGITREKR